MASTSSQELIWKRITILIIQLLYTVQSQMDYGAMMSFGMDGGDPPVLEDEEVTIEAKVGSRVVLPCTVRNSNTYMIAWLVDLTTMVSTGDNIMIDNPRYSINNDTQDEWKLVIENVQFNDSNAYSCMVQTFPPQMKMVNLIVFGPPAIQKTSLEERYIIKKGESLHIICQVSGTPQPIVQWFSYKTNPESLQEEKEVFSTSGNLSIRGIKQSFDGIYGCEAENAHGKDMYETVIETAYAPVAKTNQQIIYVKEGSLATLQCEAESMPTPKMAWQRKGEIIKNNWKYGVSMYADSETKIDTTLEFAAEKEDEGTYFCVASNIHGQNNIVIKVIVARDSTEATTRKPQTTTTPRIWITRTPKPTQKQTPGSIVEKTTQHIRLETPKTDRSSDASMLRISVFMLLFTIFLSALHV